MSDDDDELAELRAQRAARTGQISLVSRSTSRADLCQTKLPRLLCQLRLLLQTLLRQKLDNARAGGPNDSTTDADVIGPPSEELHAPSLNGTNGHAAPAVEVSTSISTA